ncbi:MAG: hypothetical protein J6J82_03840 [Alphaproteobacteria bacterium]|nr:hypothetical protein [Alphaproteobacteria bacterium]
MDDIFDLSKVNNVPESIKADLGLDEFAEEIIKLFTIADQPLNINQVFIAHYKMFSATKNSDGNYETKPDVKPKTKRQITLKLYSMSKEPDSVIISIGRGTYKLNTCKKEQLALPL